MVELGEVGEDGETVGFGALCHVEGVQQGRDVQLAFSHLEHQAAVPK